MPIDTAINNCETNSDCRPKRTVIRKPNIRIRTRVRFGQESDYPMCSVSTVCGLCNVCTGCRVCTMCTVCIVCTCTVCIVCIVRLCVLYVCIVCILAVSWTSSSN